jgi:hypothetical protein
MYKFKDSTCVRAHMGFPSSMMWLIVLHMWVRRQAPDKTALPVYYGVRDTVYTVYNLCTHAYIIHIYLLVLIASASSRQSRAPSLQLLASNSVSDVVFLIMFIKARPAADTSLLPPVVLLLRPPPPEPRRSSLGRGLLVLLYEYASRHSFDDSPIPFHARDTARRYLLSPMAGQRILCWGLCVYVCMYVYILTSLRRRWFQENRIYIHTYIYIYIYSYTWYKRKLITWDH